MAKRFLVVCGGSGVNLLGLRQVLGVSAELQVDVHNENVIRGRRVKDQASFFVDLDLHIGTTVEALKERLAAVNGAERIEDLSEYLQEVIEDPAAKAHISFANRFSSGARALEWGLAQSPCIGSATIHNEANRQAIGQVIEQMVTKYGQGIGPESPLEVWIVASTAGGCGEGTHRFIAAMFADYIKNNLSVPLRLNFIRVGQLTYRSVDMRKTALNTFLGVAADSAFYLKAKEDFENVATNWYYIDLPDVGTGTKAKAVRGEIVEMAAKSIMLPELEEDLQKLLVNNGGAPIVIIRTGFWGRDFDDSTKYFETLKQLRVKLRDLIEPNYERKYIQGQPEPQFTGPELAEAAGQLQQASYLLERMERDWTFPKYNLSGRPTTPAPVEELMPQWEHSMKDLLDDRELDELDGEYHVMEQIRTEEGEQQQRVVLTVPQTIEEDEEWFVKIDSVHRARAWALQKLGIDLEQDNRGFVTKHLNSQGLMAELLRQAEEISRILYSFNPFVGSDRRARDASAVMGSFLDTLVKVRRLLDLETAATQVLGEQLAKSNAVLRTANSEFEIARGRVGSTASTSINAAELSDELDQLSRKNWLRLLSDAVRKGDVDLFKTEVLRGATGLREDGLRSVLGLRRTADIVDIQNRLATRMGRMFDSNRVEYEASWWAIFPLCPLPRTSTASCRRWIESWKAALKLAGKKIASASATSSRGWV